MICETCKETPTIKVTSDWISVQCKCQNITIYPDNFIKRTSIKEYDPSYKDKKGLIDDKEGVTNTQ